MYYQEQPSYQTWWSETCICHSTVATVSALYPGPPPLFPDKLTSISLLCLRRGSWITLKLKKLMKSSSREQVEECHPSPTHSATPDPNETFISSDGSGGVASPTVGDSISPPPRRNCKFNLLESAGLCHLTKPKTLTWYYYY